jgi:two-component system nitrate/nitrite response regulator NarL
MVNESPVRADPVRVEEDVIRLMIVDDHAMFREGLVRMLGKDAGFNIVAQAGSAAEALRLLAQANPAVVLLDVDLGAERAIDFVLGARRAHYEGMVLAGVTGIVHKHHSIEILRDAITKVAKGEVSIENSYLLPVLRSMDRTRKPKTPMLTPRDKAVVGSVLQGLTNREMAVKLAISEGAIKASMRHVCAKLGVRTRSQLVKVALEQYKDQL